MLDTVTIMLDKDEVENQLNTYNYLPSFIRILRDNGYQISKQFYSLQDIVNYINEKILFEINLQVTCVFTDDGFIYEFSTNNDTSVHLTVYKQHKLIYNSLQYYDELYDIVENKTIPSMI